MSRKAYETPEDREREAQVAKRAARVWKCEAIPLPRFYPLDYGFLRDGRLRAWVEIKCKNCASTKSPFFILSASKWKTGLEYSERFGVPFILIFAFEDGIFYLVIDDMKPPLKWNGRKDRGDSQDMEPVVYLKIDQFKPLKEKP